MPRYFSKKILPYAHEDLFRLVQDVRAYPLFLPGCKSLTVYSETSQTIDAQMTIVWQFVSGTFRTFVELTPFEKISIHYTEGPFKHLKSGWAFKPVQNDDDTLETLLEFFIEISFDSLLKDNLANLFFKQMTNEIVDAFERRAEQLYAEKLLH